MKYSINAPHAPEPDGPYSQGTTAGRLVFAAGQLGRDRDNPDRLVEGGIRAQTARILEIVDALLAESDCTLTDVAKVTIYLADLDDLDAVDEVYSQYFVTPAPARAVVEVSRLPLGALIQMDCVACR